MAMDQQERIAKLYESSIKLTASNGEKTLEGKYRFFKLDNVQKAVAKMSPNDALFLLGIVVFSLQRQDYDGFTFLCSQLGNKIELSEMESGKDFASYIDGLVNETKDLFMYEKSYDDLTESEKKFVEG